MNYRQFLGVRSLVWVPLGCLSDGCHRTESNSSCLFSNESFHWLDTYDGCISNLAIVHRPFPSWSWHRLRNSNMSGLYFWDMSASIERCVWIISTNFHRSVWLMKWLILTIFLLKDMLFVYQYIAFYCYNILIIHYCVQGTGGRSKKLLRDIRSAFNFRNSQDYIHSNSRD